MCLTMVHYDPDPSLIRLPMHTFPQLLKLPYPPSNTSLARTPFTPTGLHMYMYTYIQGQEKWEQYCSNAS